MKNFAIGLEIGHNSFTIHVRTTASSTLQTPQGQSHAAVNEELDQLEETHQLSEDVDALG